jgi:hypothetical protein
MSKFIKIARHGAPSPVEHHAWRELLDDFDQRLEAVASSEEEEAVVDLWLEEPRSFMEGLENSPEGNVQASAVRRVRTGGMGLQRHNPMARVASATSWDQEFADAKNHADSVLKKLGNA